MGTRKTLYGLIAAAVIAVPGVLWFTADNNDQPQGDVAATIAQEAPATLETFAIPAEKPNFLVIVADDMGWSDLGFLGSTIRTPTLDALANSGTFFTDFYVAPTCAPTRAMLMTGVDSHAAGVGTMPGLQAPNQRRLTEYGAQLHDGVVTVAEMLQKHGYATLMSGKWHLAQDEQQMPNKRGFDQAYGLLGGGASHFADRKKIHVVEEVEYHENGEPIDLPADFYSTITYTDKIIEYIDGSGDEPFFAYLAYTAPHDPLQVPDDWLDSYAGVFDAGPAHFKEKRRQRLVELGIIPADAKMAPTLNFPAFLDSHKRAWDERDADEQADDIRRMEIYAAMVEIVDQQIGRLLDHVAAAGKLDNTYVLFMSDNGASTGTPLLYPQNTREWLHENYDLSTDHMGKPGSFTTMGRDWANNSNTPFRLFKGTVGEGGVRSPFIIAGPGVGQNALRKAPVQVTDVKPTILELASLDAGTDPLYQQKLLPHGRSLLPFVANTELDSTKPVAMELFENKMIRQGQWKAVFVRPPAGSGEWELYDVIADPSEQDNLAEVHPDVIQTLLEDYAAYADRNNLVPADPPLRVRLESLYEGECNWYCSLKFRTAGWIANR